MTDAPNSVSEFGWRKPHPRRTPPCWPVGRPVGAGEARRWSRQKKKRLSLRSYGRGTRPAAQRDAALNGPAQLR